MLVGGGWGRSRGRDDVVVAHVEGIGVALGHLLLQLLVREAQQVKERVR